MKCAAVLLAIGWITGQTVPAPAPITVAADDSLTAGLSAVAEQYGRDAGGDVRFLFAPTADLVDRIVHGTAADLFIGIDDRAQPLEAAGRLVPGTRAAVLLNQLAVVVAGDRQRTFASIHDLEDPAFARIAIGDPARVPEGAYAKAYLQTAGVWQALEPRMVPLPSAADALAMVAAGGASAAMVYRTEARTAPGGTVAWVVPLDNGPRIAYDAGVLSASRVRDAARRFLDYLRGASAGRILRRFGFTPTP